MFVKEMNVNTVEVPAEVGDLESDMSRVVEAEVEGAFGFVALLCALHDCRLQLLEALLVSLHFRDQLLTRHPSQVLVALRSHRLEHLLRSDVSVACCCH